jgi:hypothetical protein
MKKKHPLTLLEIVIVMLLMGFLLTGLFNLFYQAMRKHKEVAALKHTLLQVELFEHVVKRLLTESKRVWSTSHSLSPQDVLCLQYIPEVDREWEAGSEIRGLLYLSGQGDLSFISWAASGAAPHRTVLLDKVEGFACRFFDAKEKEWVSRWPAAQEEMPAILSIEITWGGRKIPFTFFPFNDKEEILYSGMR